MKLMMVVVSGWIAFALASPGCGQPATKRGVGIDYDGTCMGGSVRIAGRCTCPLGTKWQRNMCDGTEQSGSCPGGQISFGPTASPTCLCLHQTIWDGTQCVANPQTTPPVCGDGTTWDGTQCVANAQQPPAPTCGPGTFWDGAQCVAAVQPPPNVPPNVPPPGEPQSCATSVLAKGYPAEAVKNCHDVHPRCAQAVLDKNFPVEALRFCLHVNPVCAEAVLAHNYPVESLSYCAHVEGACAAAMLDKGYGPEALTNCKR
jgi:hypothetical protein